MQALHVYTTTNIRFTISSRDLNDNKTQSKSYNVCMAKLTVITY